MEKDNYKIIYGKIIKEYRLKNKLTQEELSQKIGFDTKYISQIETGRYMGTIITMLKLCEIFGVTPNDLLDELLPKNEKENKTFKNFSKLAQKDKELIATLIDYILSNY